MNQGSPDAGLFRNRLRDVHEEVRASEAVAPFVEPYRVFSGYFHLQHIYAFRICLAYEARPLVFHLAVEIYELTMHHVATAVLYPYPGIARPVV